MTVLSTKKFTKKRKKLKSTTTPISTVLSTQSTIFSEMVSSDPDKQQKTTTFNEIETKLIIQTTINPITEEISTIGEETTTKEIIFTTTRED